MKVSSKKLANDLHLDEKGIVAKKSNPVVMFINRMFGRFTGSNQKDEAKMHNIRKKEPVPSEQHPFGLSTSARRRLEEEAMGKHGMG